MHSHTRSFVCSTRHLANGDGLGEILQYASGVEVLSTKLGKEPT